ncbi:MAG: hypothetical protein E6614_38125, partial [Bradyrhizobium sp.]|nr:hypothetical protein [Bradyrhizobium sp.]
AVAPAAATAQTVRICLIIIALAVSPSRRLGHLLCQMAEDSGAFKTFWAKSVPVRRFVIMSPSLHGSLTPLKKCNEAAASPTDASI